MAELKTSQGVGGVSWESSLAGMKSVLGVVHKNSIQTSLWLVPSEGSVGFLVQALKRIFNQQQCLKYIESLAQVKFHVWNWHNQS